MSRTWKRLVALLLGGLLLGAVAVAAVLVALPRHPLLAGYDRIEPGMDEAAVLAALGEPTAVDFLPPGQDRKHCTWLPPEPGVRPMVVVLLDADRTVVWKSWLLVDRTGKLGPAYPTWWQQLQARWGC